MMTFGLVTGASGNSLHIPFRHVSFRGSVALLSFRFCFPFLVFWSERGPWVLLERNPAVGNQSDKLQLCQVRNIRNNPFLPSSRVLSLRSFAALHLGYFRVVFVGVVSINVPVS